MDFKFYNLNIAQESKVAWEEGTINNPRFSLKLINNQELTLDEVEQIMLDNIRNSFSELKEALVSNEFIEAKLIMPALQICSVDKLNIIDLGINIFDKIDDDDIVDDPIQESEHPSELIEQIGYLMNSDLFNEYEDEGEDGYYIEDSVESDESDEVDDEEEVENIEDNENSISEDELDIIKKSINGIS